MPRRSTRAAALLALAGLLAGRAPARAAYCGCDKPPPDPNVAVRPEFSYPGASIILFSEDFVVGREYTVNFYRFRLLSLVGLLQPRLDARTRARAVRARDQGDFDPLDPTAPLPLRTQLRVKLPRTLEYGPARIEVVDPATGARVLVIGEDDFTVIGEPIVLRENMPPRVIPYETGMSRDGHLFFAFDMSRVRNPILLDAEIVDLLLPLFSEGMTGWNVQGFNVGTLRDVPDDPRFGWRLFDPNGHDVSILGNASRVSYWRHEFWTWELAHHAGGPKVQVDDPLDHDFWHEDGTPHIDHDHIVVAVDVHELDLSRLLSGTELNLIRLHLSTTPSANPYAGDPNPTH
jgi:hypothetical protein